MQLKADKLERLDIKDLNKNKLLNASSSSKITFSDGLEAEMTIYPYYTNGSIDLSFLNESILDEDRTIQIHLETTPCNFGNMRFWFLCPGTTRNFCNNRVRTLYKVGHELSCRECHNLTYSSKKSPYDMAEVALKETRMFYKLEEYKKLVKRKTYANKPTKALIRLNDYYGKYVSIRKMTDSLIFK